MNFEKKSVLIPFDCILFVEQVEMMQLQVLALVYLACVLPGCFLQRLGDGQNSEDKFRLSGTEAGEIVPGNLENYDVEDYNSSDVISPSNNDAISAGQFIDGVNGNQGIGQENDNDVKVFGSSDINIYGSRDVRRPGNSEDRVTGFLLPNHENNKDVNNFRSNDVNNHMGRDDISPGHSESRVTGPLVSGRKNNNNANVYSSNDVIASNSHNAIRPVKSETHTSSHLAHGSKDKNSLDLSESSEVMNPNPPEVFMTGNIIIIGCNETEVIEIPQDLKDYVKDMEDRLNGKNKTDLNQKPKTNFLDIIRNKSDEYLMNKSHRTDENASVNSSHTGRDGNVNTGFNIQHTNSGDNNRTVDGVFGSEFFNGTDRSAFNPNLSFSPDDNTTGYDNEIMSEIHTELVNTALTELTNSSVLDYLMVILNENLNSSKELQYFLSKKVSKVSTGSDSQNDFNFTKQEMTELMNEILKEQPNYVINDLINNVLNPSVNESINIQNFLLNATYNILNQTDRFLDINDTSFFLANGSNVINYEEFRLSFINNTFENSSSNNNEEMRKHFEVFFEQLFQQASNNSMGEDFSELVKHNMNYSQMVDEMVYKELMMFMNMSINSNMTTQEVEELSSLIHEVTGFFVEKHLQNVLKTKSNNSMVYEPLVNGTSWENMSTLEMEINELISKVHSEFPNTSVEELFSELLKSNESHFEEIKDALWKELSYLTNGSFEHNATKMSLQQLMETVMQEIENVTVNDMLYNILKHHTNTSFVTGNILEGMGKSNWDTDKRNTTKETHDSHFTNNTNSHEIDVTSETKWPTANITNESTPTTQPNIKDLIDQVLQLSANSSETDLINQLLSLNQTYSQEIKHILFQEMSTLFNTTFFNNTGSTNMSITEQDWNQLIGTILQEQTDTRSFEYNITIDSNDKATDFLSLLNNDTLKQLNNPLNAEIDNYINEMLTNYTSTQQFLMEILRNNTSNTMISDIVANSLQKLVNSTGSFDQNNMTNQELKFLLKSVFMEQPEIVVKDMVLTGNKHDNQFEHSTRMPSHSQTEETGISDHSEKTSSYNHHPTTSSSDHSSHTTTNEHRENSSSYGHGVTTASYENNSNKNTQKHRESTSTYHQSTGKPTNDQSTSMVGEDHTSNPNLSDHTQRNDYIGSTQRNDQTGSTQRNDYIGSTQRNDQTGSTQRNDYIGSTQINDQTDSTQSNNQAGSTQRNYYIVSTQRTDYIGSTQRNDQKDSTQRNDYIGSTQRNDQTGSTQRNDYIGSTQRNDYIGSTQRNDYIGSTQRNDYIGSTQRNDQTGSTQRNDYIGSTQRNDYIGSTQRNDYIGSTQRNDQTGSTQRNEYIGSTQRNDYIGSTQRNDQTGSTQRNDQAGSTQRNYYIVSTQRTDYIGSTQRNDQKDSTQRNDYIGSTQRNDQTGSTQRNDYIGSTQRNDYIGSTQRNDYIGSTQRNDQTGSTQRNDYIGSTQRNDQTGSTQRNDQTGSTQRNDYIGSTQRNDQTGSTQRNDQAGSTQRNDQTGSTQRNDQTGSTQRNDQTGSTQRNDQTGSTQRNDQTGSTQRNDQTGSTQRNDQTGSTQRNDFSSTTQRTAHADNTHTDSPTGRTQNLDHSDSTPRTVFSAGTPAYDKTDHTSFDHTDPTIYDRYSSTRTADDKLSTPRYDGGVGITSNDKNPSTPTYDYNSSGRPYDSSTGNLPYDYTPRNLPNDHSSSNLPSDHSTGNLPNDHNTTPSYDNTDDAKNSSLTSENTNSSSSLSVDVLNILNNISSNLGLNMSISNQDWRNDTQYVVKEFVKSIFEGQSNITIDRSLNGAAGFDFFESANTSVSKNNSEINNFILALLGSKVNDSSMLEVFNNTDIDVREYIGLAQDFLGNTKLNSSDLDFISVVSKEIYTLLQTDIIEISNVKDEVKPENEMEVLLDSISTMYGGNKDAVGILNRCREIITVVAAAFGEESSQEVQVLQDVIEIMTCTLAGNAEAAIRKHRYFMENGYQNMAEVLTSVFHSKQSASRMFETMMDMANKLTTMIGGYNSVYSTIEKKFDEMFEKHGRRMRYPSLGSEERDESGDEFKTQRKPKHGHHVDDKNNVDRNDSMYARLFGKQITKHEKSNHTSHAEVSNKTENHAQKITNMKHVPRSLANQIEKIFLNSQWAEDIGIRSSIIRILILADEFLSLLTRHDMYSILHGTRVHLDRVHCVVSATQCYLVQRDLTKLGHKTKTLWRKVEESSSSTQFSHLMEILKLTKELYTDVSFTYEKWSDRMNE
ncbi:putative uncharacterized protein DDB_G0282133 [Physella acuta]|uniref:putative uncharacterized protein DDB_G0282133 n=1 Tax=Physella acuta TaxID=109671 RepID=UPI0027DD5EB5|nr:putative uncharacterized protein DDB_G0282133 [Physella acuta]